MRSSVVLIPTYSERDNLLRVLPRLSLIEDLDVLVIDDASPDGTGDLAEDLRSRYPRLSVLHRRKKEGLGRAYLHGFRIALEEEYEALVTMDADLSHAPEDIPRLLAALEEADVALGSRHVPGGGVVGWPASRRLLSWAGGLYARALLRLPAKDVTSGFRAYRASALRALDLEKIHARGFIFQVEILRRILDLPGARAVEVPIVFRERALGRSKLTAGIIAEAVWEVLRLTGRRRDSRPKPSRRSRAQDPSAPWVTVVIPARPGGGAPRALSALPDVSYPAGKLEVIVARGIAPAGQRNEAVRRTSGEFILFLDDDSLAEPDLIRKHLEVMAGDPTVAAVGGPSISSPKTFLERVFSLLLSEPLLVGKTASRYTERGKTRYTDEGELILCNLLVRRRAFEEAGCLDERLYPNEENELLERLRLRRWRLVYRPDATVLRPERRTMREFLSTVFRYGVGRGRQLRILKSRTSIARCGILIACILGAFSSLAGVLTGTALFLAPVLFYLAYLGIIAVRLGLRGGLAGSLLGGSLAAFLHIFYALGLARGILLPLSRAQVGRVALERIDLRGEVSPGKAA